MRFELARNQTSKFLQSAPKLRGTFHRANRLDALLGARNPLAGSFAACASRLAAVTDYPCAFVIMDSSVIRYASRSKALRDLNAWIESKSPIPPGSVAHRLVEDGEWSGEDAAISQDVWFRDRPKGYDLTELAKHYPNYDETFALLWFEQDSGPDEPVKNFNGVPLGHDDGGLKELDGVLEFSKKTPRR